MSDTSKPRKTAMTLVLSMASIIGIAAFEGYTEKAVIPVPGDVPTYGYGTTRHEDGNPIRMGEATTREQAMRDLQRDAGEFAQAVKRCAPVPMYQHEFDAYVSFTYNVGSNAFCKSTLAKRLNALDYAGACRELLKWDKVQGRAVQGLTNRREAEYNQCTGGRS